MEPVIEWEFVREYKMESGIKCEIGTEEGSIIEIMVW